ncbi:aldo/keto reductase [Actinoplanes regularis]|uniref:aldo/keto reductase n=1 Tax=Actinoplanes regularis TaxID=52697 RepID=UPI00249FE787|nr:aldo/keto reductase [Actinoplanes regularis]GLW32916.1 oxidoreductase [Actinoplanes regularis]
MDTGLLDASAAGTWRLGDRVVNRMGFGSMRLTANPDTGVAVRVLRRAVELGVDHLDTAAFYCSPGGIIDVGPGPVRHATELIRAALTPYRDRVFIATKVGPERLPDGRWGEAGSPARLRRQVEENLRRLGVETLDLVNLRINRRAAPPASASDSASAAPSASAAAAVSASASTAVSASAAFAERFGALAEMRAEGLIRHLGLSNISREHLDEASRIAPVVCVQNAYSVDLRRDDDLLRICGERGIAFVPFFAIAGPAREAGAAREQSDALRRVAARHGVSEHQVRLAWTLHQGSHVLAIPGTGDLGHLEQNIAAASLHLTDSDLAELHR